MNMHTRAGGDLVTPMGTAMGDVVPQVVVRVLVI